MPDARTREAEQIELLYKEHQRIGNSMDRLMKSSFDDFRLFGAVIGFLSWKPIVEFLSKGRGVAPEDKPFVVFIGFVAFLLVFHVISFRDLIKQSIIYFRALEIEKYERQLRKLSRVHMSVFSGAKNWQSWLSSCHVPVFRMFVALVFLPVVVLPTVLLYVGTPGSMFWVGYLSLAVLLLGWYSVALALILRQRKPRKRKKAFLQGVTSGSATT